MAACKCRCLWRSKVLGVLRLEIQVTVSHPTRVLGLKLSPEEEHHVFPTTTPFLQCSVWVFKIHPFSCSLILVADTVYLPLNPCSALGLDVACGRLDRDRD